MRLATNLPPSNAGKALQLLVCGALLCATLPASTILDTYPDSLGDFTNGFVKAAQTFTVGTDNVLTSFQFRMFNAPGQSVDLQIFAWNSSGPTGPALFTSQTFLRDNTIHEFVASNINLTLTQGLLYGAVVDSLNSYSGPNFGYNLNRNSYNGGALWLLQQGTSNWSDFTGSNLNLTFTANLTNGPVASGVPEPSAYLLIGGGLTGMVALTRRSRRP